MIDDLASMPLDLWAAERGYQSARPNLLGFDESAHSHDRCGIHPA
jgi:hypothetical protein